MRQTHAGPSTSQPPANLAWSSAGRFAPARVSCGAVAVWLLAGSACAASWVGDDGGTNPLRWGLEGGLQFAIHPAGFRGGDGGPRGLIRLGYPTLPGGRYDLINYLAIEPVVQGRRGFSELERSASDRLPGKRIRADGPARRTRPAPGVEQLEVGLVVERFDHGAEVRLTLSQRSDAPDELRLAVHRAPGSAPLDYCILTATMGNFARARRLWLKDGPVDSRTLYPDFRGQGFAPHTLYPRSRLTVTAAGEVLVALTTDEAEPAAVRPFPGSGLWYYGGAPVTQFWKKPRGTRRPELEVAVNARFTYWQSARPIPGGVSFENFELRERFFQGQVFVFGLTRRLPAELGLSLGAAAAPAAGPRGGAR